MLHILVFTVVVLVMTPLLLFVKFVAERQAVKDASARSRTRLPKDDKGWEEIQKRHKEIFFDVLEEQMKGSASMLFGASHDAGYTP